MVKATREVGIIFVAIHIFNLHEPLTFVAAKASLLNGRPLTRVDVNTGSQILTPNSFLFGNLGGAITTDRIDCPVKR
jgi:hypothetical protein